MRFALFLGCQIPARLNQYESSSRAVLQKLGMELVDIREFNCCGYPLRNIDFKAFLLSSARNLALAEKKNLNVIALCQCCYGSLKKVDFLMKENPPLQKEVNATLQKEGLKVEGKSEIKHILSVLYNEMMTGSIKEKIEKTTKGLKIATHYGCHVLRPSKVVQFDDPIEPSIIDKLVELTGAESMDWSAKLDCCGAPLWGINDRLSMDLTLKKLTNGKESGADYLCVACPYCHLQFDTIQKMILSQRNVNHPLPSILYPQLLGLCMGIDGKTLGLEMNQIPIGDIENFVIEPMELSTEKAEIRGEEKDGSK